MGLVSACDWDMLAITDLDGTNCLEHTACTSALNCKVHITSGLCTRQIGFDTPYISVLTFT